MHLLPHNHTWWIVFTPRPTPGGSYSHKFHTWRVVFTQQHVGCAEIPLAFWICDPPCEEQDSFKERTGPWLFRC